MDFDKDLARGKLGEKILDKHFSSRFLIQKVSVQEEINLGYDRIFTRISDGKVYTVEYKTDYQTLKTGNLFLETKVFTYSTQATKPGWLYHSQADIIAYYIGPLVLILNGPALKEVISDKIGTIKNDINSAEGYLVKYFDIFDNKNITIRSEKCN